MLNYVVGASLIACCMPAAALAAEAGRADGRRPAAPADHRLHATPTGERAAIVDAPGSRLRTGFGGAMVALYPFGNSGIHVSAGGRLSSRGFRSRFGELDTARLLAGARGGGRTSRRPNPAALVGIDHAFGHGLAIGIDGGATLGRLDSAPGRIARFHMGRGGGEGRLNQIARVTALYRF